MQTITRDMIEYYEEDESLVDAVERYYGESETVSDIDRMSTAVWVGSNAIVQKLGTYVKREDFKALSRGFLPDSLKGVAGSAVQRIRGKKPNEEDKERLAHDVTLSAPKSVSMALHLEGDNRLFDAHMEAVLESFELLEREYAQTRIQVNGVRSVVNTGNMIAALMPHHTSRDGDMQLHTHMLLMNGTQGPDGQWRSLSHEKLAKAKWIGSFYRQKLAEKVQRLGYRIYETKDGFELEGYNRSDVEVFSKRHRAIVKAVRDEGLEVTPENKKLKVLTTRKAKRGVGKKLEIIQDHWRDEAHSQGVGHPVLAEPLAVMPDPDRARYEVESAIRHYAEWSSIFETDDIYAYVFKTLKRQGMAMEQVDEAISQSKELIPVDRGFTTVTAVEEEAQIHQRWMEGQDQAQPMVANPSLLGIAVELNEDQAKAVLNTLTSTDRYQIWQGFPGVGKSRTLGVLKTLLNGSGLTIRGFSPTIPAAKKLQDELGIATNTVEHLVLHQADNSPNQVWLVDEAGMMSRRQMRVILEKAEAVKAQVIFVGDAGQNSAIEAGNPFKFMQHNGATTHRIEEIVRQKVDVQKQAVELIARGQGLKALDLLNAKGYVIEADDKTEMTQAAAAQFLALSPNEQDQTLIIAGTNKERLAAEKAIRRGEKKLGRLGESSKIVQLKSRNLSIEQKRRVDWYRKGDYVRLLQTSKTSSIKRGQLYKVEKCEGDELVVSSFGGRLYRFNPAKYKQKEVYSAQEFDVAVGDKLRWTTTIRENNWINGQQLTVTALDSLNMTVRDHKGVSHDVPLTQPLALEYDRVWTSYRSQSGSKKRTIVITTNDRTSSREPFLVDISRQEHELTIYTENLEKLKKRVVKSNAQESALDLIEETYGHQRTTTADRGRASRPISPTHGRDHHPDQSSRRSPSSEPTHPRREQRTQVPGQGADQHYPDGGQSRSQPVHPGVQGRNGSQEALGHEREYQATRQGDGQSWDEDRRLNDAPSRDERQGIGSRRGDPGGQASGVQEWQAQAQDSRSTEWGSTSSDLANWVMQWSEENELATSGLDNHLLTLAKDIESLSQSLKPNSFNGLDSLANRVVQDQFADALADNLTQITQAIDQAIEKSLPHQQFRSIADDVIAWQASQEFAELGLEPQLLDLAQRVDTLSQNLEPNSFVGLDGLAETVVQARDQQDLSHNLTYIAQSIDHIDQNIEQTLSQQRIRSIADAVAEWRSGQELADAVTEMVDVLAQGTEGLDRTIIRLQAGLEATQSLDVKFPAMAELVDAVQDWQNEVEVTAAIGEVQDLVESLTIPQFPDMGDLAQDVHDLNEEQALAESGLVEQLAALTTQINTLSEPQQIQFKGMDQLAEVVSELQQGQSLTQVQPQLQAITQQIEAFNAKRPTYSFAKIKGLADTVSEWRAHESIAQHIGELNNLVVRFQRSLKTFPAMQQLAQSVKSMRSVDALVNGPVAEQLKEVAQQLTDKGISVTPKPKTIDDQVFWKPDYTGVERPDTIDEKHWDEWVSSCAHPDVIKARLQSIADDQVIDRLLGAKIEDIATRRRDGSFKKVRSQYHIEPIRALINDRSHPEVLSYQELAEGGGWWADAGVDPLTFEGLGPNEEPTLSLYGTFKPDTPRIDVDKTHRARTKNPNAPPKYRKYENPLGAKRKLFDRDMAFQPVPDPIAKQIFAKHGVTQTQEEKAKGFWYTVYQHPEIPIYRTEGDKKDAALVSQGRVVIGGQGVNIGYRAKNQHDERLERRVLHPQLEVFAAPGREFRYAHDWDSEQSTVWNVRREMVREAELIEERGCKTWRIPWEPEQGKGVDDLIGNHGPIAFERADQNAYPMDREIKMHYRGQYTQIKNKLSRENPQHNNDIAIYLIAQGEGDAMDGTRVLMQSDAARELKSPEDKQRYIQGVIHFTHSYQDALYKGRSTKVFERRLFLLQHKSQPTQTVNLDKELEM
nr:MobF family relaxase [Acaryochloris marina]